MLLVSLLVTKLHPIQTDWHLSQLILEGPGHSNIKFANFLKCDPWLIDTKCHTESSIENQCLSL